MLGSQSVCSLLVSQLTYQNFGRYNYNMRQCAAADLGTMTWLAMHCDFELDWICKLPRGTTVLNFSFGPSPVFLLYIGSGHF